jgi:hypothetical protein
MVVFVKVIVSRDHFLYIKGFFANTGNIAGKIAGNISGKISVTSTCLIAGVITSNVADIVGVTDDVASIVADTFVIAGIVAHIVVGTCLVVFKISSACRDIDVLVVVVVSSSIGGMYDKNNTLD